MIAVARNISYGAAYTEYAAKKEKAVFIGSENMVGDFGLVFDNNQLYDIWFEFKEAGRDYKRRGKEVTRNLFVIEYSPTSDESKNWSKKDWFDHARELLEEIDKVSLQIPKKDKKNGKWILDENGKKKLFRVPKTQLVNSKWMAMLHRDSESGIWHLHILASRFTRDNKLNNNYDIAKRAAQAAEIINQRHGWIQAMDIRQQHINEINGVINDILANNADDEISWDNFVNKVSEATFTDYKGKQQHYTIRLHQGNDGNIGYSIGRGKSIYTATELGQKMTYIGVDLKTYLKDTVYSALRGMNGRVFDWDRFIFLMANSRCRVELKHDSKGNVVNYSMTFKDKQYNASQIGAKLTAKKIVKEWEHIHHTKAEQPRQTAKPTPKSQTMASPFIFFADVRPTVFIDVNNHTCIKVMIEGHEYDSVPLSAEHTRWYNQQNNKEAAAFQLALHYYRDEIQLTQLRNYHEQHFNAGELPYGISIDKAYPSTNGQMSWVKGWMTYGGQQFDRTVRIPNEEYKKYYTAAEKEQIGILRRLVSRFIGPKLLENVQIPFISEIISDRFDTPAAADTVEALNQTVETFKDFTQDLCESFAAACGDIATAYFEAVMGTHGITPSSGGGGHDTGGWGKKDDDDYPDRRIGLFKYKSPKKPDLRRHL